MDRQLSVFYFSATDGTKKVVKGIAEGISDSFKEYNFTLPTNRQDELVFNDKDLVIIGVPVYAGRVPLFLMDFLQKVKGNNTPAIFVTVYGNRDYEDALIELKDTFEKNGFVGVAGGAFVGEHSLTSDLATNRPDSNDLEVAKKFGCEIKNKLESIENISEISKLVVKGNFPYKEVQASPKMVPDTNNDCINCGICAKHCPTGSINFDNYKEVALEKCVRCCSCVKRCPKNAKAINHEMYGKMTKFLVDNFGAVRKEPEYFI